MPHHMTKIMGTTIITALSLLTIIHHHASAQEEYLCSIGPDGKEDCQAVYFEPELADVPPPDANGDEQDADSYWRSALALEECTDHSEDCESLAESGECESNPGYMKYECAVSCGTCLAFDAAYAALRDGSTTQENGPCTDKYRECKNWGAMGECAFNPNFMLVECERSCMVCFEDTNQFGVHQEVTHDSDESHDKTNQVIQNSIDYMKKLWAPTPDNNRINYKCRNMDKLCSYWAATNECGGDNDENNADWMHSNCAPACQTCHTLDSQLRCPIEEDNKLAMEPGGLNSLMENIVDDADGSGEYTKYNPKALSRPRMKGDGTRAPWEGKDGPWVVVLENFICDEEADVLIAAGHRKGYERSSDVGVENPDGTHEEEVSDGRTSTNSWCDEELCDKDPIIKRVTDRIAHTTKTEVHNSEHLQLLRYEPGQYYNQHHDYIEYQQDLPCGVRMFTLFLYLNDVEEGGGTGFPLLDITVQPKKGRALLWPSVLDSNPEEKDGRTDHEALPVIKGHKYGANAWIHTRDYRKAEKNDCA